MGLECRNLERTPHLSHARLSLLLRHYQRRSSPHYWSSLALTGPNRPSLILTDSQRFSTYIMGPQRHSLALTGPYGPSVFRINLHQTHQPCHSPKLFYRHYYHCGCVPVIKFIKKHPLLRMRQDVTITTRRDWNQVLLQWGLPSVSQGREYCLSLKVGNRFPRRGQQTQRTEYAYGAGVWHRQLPRLSGKQRPDALLWSALASPKNLAGKVSKLNILVFA